MRKYPSLDAARRAFDEYAAAEPRLTTLWDMCRRAAPPAHANDGVDDAYDVDVFDVDDVSTAKPDDGWCAEDLFFEHVKSRLMLLVGVYRPSGPDELRTTRAYDTVYAALLDWALHRPCACCAEHESDSSYGADAEYR